MGTKAQIASADYLRMTFPDRLEPELVDGELRERAFPNYVHSYLQVLLGSLFLHASGPRRLYTGSDLRVKVGPRNYRGIYVVAYLDRQPPACPDYAPLVAIEILSPDDRYQDVQGKCREYRDWGVTNVWIVDPNQKELSEYRDSGLITVDALALPDYGVHITMAGLLAGLDEG